MSEISGHAVLLTVANTLDASKGVRLEIYRCLALKRYVLKHTVVSLEFVADEPLPPPLPPETIPPRAVRTLPAPAFIFPNPLSLSDKCCKLLTKFSVMVSVASYTYTIMSLLL